MTEHETGEKHRGETAGHSQRLVVGLFGKQEQKDIVLTTVGCQFAVLVAGDIYVCNVLAEAVCDVHCANRLGAVTGASEADEQQGFICVQQVLGVGNEVGGGHRAYVFPNASHNGLDGVAYESRGAGAGQYDIGVRSEVLVHECTDLSLCVQQRLKLLAPHSRLLVDFVKGE